MRTYLISYFLLLGGLCLQAQLDPSTFTDLQTRSHETVHDSVLLFTNVAKTNVESFSTPINAPASQEPIEVLLRVGIVTDSTIQVFVLFSKQVVNFGREDVTVINGSVEELRGADASFTLVVKSFVETEGIVEIGLLEGAVRDARGAGNVFAAIGVIVDLTRPLSKIVSPLHGSTTEEVIPLLISFDDPVYNFSVDPIGCLILDKECFTEEDLVVDGGRISNFSQINDSNFTLDLVLIAPTVSMQVAENVAFNIGELGNHASEIFEIEYLNGVLGTESNHVVDYWVQERGTLSIAMNDKSVEGNLKLMDLRGNVILASKIHQGQWNGSVSGIGAGVYVLFIEIGDEIVKTKIRLKK